MFAVLRCSNIATATRSVENGPVVLSRELSAGSEVSDNVGRIGRDSPNERLHLLLPAHRSLAEHSRGESVDGLEEGVAGLITVDHRRRRAEASSIEPGCSLSLMQQSRESRGGQPLAR
jgi:hypothetical protein